MTSDFDYVILLVRLLWLLGLFGMFSSIIFDWITRREYKWVWIAANISVSIAVLSQIADELINIFYFK